MGAFVHIDHMKMKTLYLSVGLLTQSLTYAAEIPVYIGSGAETGISKGVLDTNTGELKEVNIAVEVSKPGALAISNDRKTIYSILKEKGEKSGFVASYAVKDDGGLELLGKQSSMGLGACHLSLDKASNVLFVANYSGGSIASYQISGSKLSEAVSFHQHEGKSVNKKRQNSPHAHSIYASPDNKFVYVADLGIDKVIVYKLDQETAKLSLSSSAAVPAGSGPRHMVFSADGSKLYVLNELTLSVSRFARDASSGELTLEETKPVMAELSDRMTCSEIQLSKDGKFIYTAIRDLDGKKRDVISILSAEDMSIIQEHPAGVSIPRHFGISPSGKWLLIAGQKSDQVIVHARDVATGKLTSTEHSAEVKQPMWILFK